MSGTKQKFCEVCRGYLAAFCAITLLRSSLKESRFAVETGLTALRWIPTKADANKHIVCWALGFFELELDILQLAGSELQREESLLYLKNRDKKTTLLENEVSFHLTSLEIAAGVSLMKDSELEAIVGCNISFVLSILKDCNLVDLLDNGESKKPTLSKFTVAQYNNLDCGAIFASIGKGKNRLIFDSDEILVSISGYTGKQSDIYLLHCVQVSYTLATAMF